MDADIHSINEKYSIPGQISFHPGPGYFILAVINNQHGAALITLTGAHVMSYRPHHGRETLWTSPSAAYEISHLGMRGGIPVCWPWFAFQPGDGHNLPIHGFARAQNFEVRTVHEKEDGATVLRMRSRDTTETHALWPHPFEFEVSITLGKSLLVEWTARNPGSQPYAYSGALHPYFLVSNVHHLALNGLEGTEFIDTIDQNLHKQQAAEVTFPAGIDNVYLHTRTDLTIHDPGYQRTIHIQKHGSNTSVVWNPYQDDASSADIGAGQHQFFVCVEAANAADDIVTVEPGCETHLGMEIEVKNWRES